jgi:hypothetical protein
MRYRADRQARRDTDEAPYGAAPALASNLRALAEVLLETGFVPDHEVGAIVTAHLDAGTRRKLRDSFEDGWRRG